MVGAIIGPGLRRRVGQPKASGLGPQALGPLGQALGLAQGEALGLRPHQGRNPLGCNLLAMGGGIHRRHNQPSRRNLPGRTHQAMLLSALRRAAPCA